MANGHVGGKIAFSQSPVKAISYAVVVFKPVIAGETVEREKVAILKFHSARIFVRDLQIGRCRGGYQLDTGCKDLCSAERFADKWPFYVGGSGKYATPLKTAITAVDGGDRAGIFIAVINVAPSE